jgi:hypothetical protein
LSPVARGRLIGASILLFSTGCQLVLGDFTLAGAPSEPPAPVGTACTPNTYRCTDNRLQTCSADRTAWDDVAQCASADQCDPTAGTCRTCAFDEFACNGSVLQKCDAMGHWQAQGTPCDSPELCQVTVDRKSGGCAKSPCPAGNGHSCTDNRLERCSASRDQLSLVDRCGSAALCDPAKADAQTAAGTLGTCEPLKCSFGQFACEGTALERCNDDQSGWTPLTTCDDAASCNPLTGDCTPCTQGDTVCSGAELWRCGPNGFARAATCAAIELCNALQKRCDKPGCSQPGAVRCVTGEPPQLEACENDLQWHVREACASQALCSESAGRCLPPACDSEETRCVGQELQVCSGDRTHWDVLKTCASNEVCDPLSCLPAPCSEGAQRCNDGTFERCVSGNWQSQHRCGPPALCDKTQGCLPPQCDSSHGDYSCTSDGILVACTEGIRSQPLTCNRPTVCDADQRACLQCEPLAYDCENDTELHRCLLDGSAAPLVMNCPGGCTVTDNVPSCAQMP